MFLKFYKEVNDEIKDETFIKFFEVCKKIFEESDNDRSKAAVYMLLEKVREKSLKYLGTLKKLEDFKTDVNSCLEYFLNIDKISKI